MLVFLGVVVTAYQTGLGQTSVTVLARFKRAAWLALGVFLLGLAAVAVSAVWLVVDGGGGLYNVTLGLFFAELAGLVSVAVYVTARVLLR
jgi:hypothetical protein